VDGGMRQRRWRKKRLMLLYYIEFKRQEAQKSLTQNS
jgi:hypothetical protein